MFHWLILLLVSSSVLAKEACNPEESYDYYFYNSPLFESSYSHLYYEMEQALLANSMVLDQLKHGFMSNQKIEVFFDVDIQVGNVSNVSCLSPWSPNAFCRSNSLDHDWNLCSSHSIVYRY